MDRTSACRYFGLPDTDEGWDALNDLVAEHDLDAELGPNGDVLRVNVNGDLAGALFKRFERVVGHRPDDPERMAEARAAIVTGHEAERDQRNADRRERLGARIAERKAFPIPRVEE
jgi:hypothetical protein